MIDGLIWLAFVLGFVGFEAFTLWREDDGWAPFTDHVRDVLNLRGGPHSLGWWVVAAFLSWSGYHFLIDS